MLLTIITIAIALIAAFGLIQVRNLRKQMKASKLEIDNLRARIAANKQSFDEAAGKLEAILSASEDAILIADASGGCRLLNNQARAYFGSLSLHKTLLAITQSAELDTLVKQAQGATVDDEPITGEILLRTLGERSVQALIKRIEPIATGSPEEFLILLRDITDLRRLETVRRDFVANVSHELRTPLSSVKAMAETLLDGALEDPTVARPFLETIISETDRLVRLSADLLVLSRIELRPVVKEDSDVSVLIDNAMSWLDNQRAKAGLTFVVHDMDRPLIAPCDTDEIAQVLVNLLDNAIKYTPRGGTITITARSRDGHIVVEVGDTGIGILQQDLPRLFERFYRTDKARGRQSGGTGLGLSIVKHIVERHGGGLWVRSEYNRGSTFGFSIPCQPDSEELIQNRQPDWSTGDSAEYLVVSAAEPSNANATQASATLH